jgi:pilus assembly protein CpaE
LSDEARTTLTKAVGDRRLAKLQPEIFTGGVAAAIQHYGETPSAEVVVVEWHESPDGLFTALENLAQVCVAGTRVIVVGRTNDVQLYRALTRRGVSEYLPLPIDPRALVDVLAAMSADPGTQRLGRLISFIGAGGGTGSSTVCHNVAWCLARQYKEDVALLDLDLAFGTVALDFNVESQQNISVALSQSDRLDDVIIERFMAKYSDNLLLLTAPASLGTPADIESAKLDAVLTVVRRNCPFVVLDLPHAWTAWTQHVLTESDEIVVTALPTLTCLRDAKNLSDAVAPKRPNDAPVRVVLNRVGAHARTELTAKDFATALGRPVAANLPNDPTAFGTASNNGQMLGEASKSHKAVAVFDEVATAVSGRQPVAKRRGGRFSLGLFAKRKTS